MAVIPVGYGNARLIFRATGSANDAVVTFGYNPSLIDPEAHALEIYGLATDANRPAAAASMSLQYTFQGVTVTEMDETGPVGGERLVQIVGTTSNDVMPPNCAILINKRTASGGRRNRGRMYVPPVFPAESGVGPSGNLQGADITTLATRWGGFLSDLQSAGLPMVILHSTPPFTPTPVTGIVINTRIATQRRRLRR